ncbi:MAG: hypothetical protein ACT4PP_15120 [Sporichthyaceae bacterium]
MDVAICADTWGLDMRRRQLASLACAALLVITGSAWASTQGGNAAPASSNSGERYEVWSTDQSGIGGRLFIHQGRDLENGPSYSPEIIDLNTLLAMACDVNNAEGVPVSGVAPQRAHIITFNRDRSRALISFVTSGHVAVLDANTRTPIDCVDVGEQAHAAFAAPNDSYAMIANQGGKKLVRLNTDVDGDGRSYESDADIELVPSATLNLATCTTPSGAPCEQAGVRPTNTIICPIVEDSSRLTFITLGGGGLIVADTSRGDRVPPIVAEYDNSTISPAGCGGMQGNSTASGGRIYFNAGASAAKTSSASLYSFPARVSAYRAANPPNTPAPRLIFSNGADTGRDSHGLMLNVKQNGRYLWAGDRSANRIEVIDTRTDTLLTNFSLASPGISTDPAPDLIEVSPKGNFAFASLRGPCPLTANVASVANAVGNTPGVGIIAINGGGRGGALVGVAPMSNVISSNLACASIGGAEVAERADAHGIAVRDLRIPGKPNARCLGERATLVGTPDRDRLIGTPGRDVIAGLGGNDVIRGRGGNDLLCGGRGRDDVNGGPGKDRITGGPGQDRLRGGPGKDRVVRRGPDRVTGVE